MADIFPYLIIKRDEVDLWLVARAMTHKRGSKGRPKGGLPNAEVRNRRLLVDEIKALKRKEYGHR